MNVADAITPIARTLRPGRSAALRSPRRQIGRQPWPPRDECGGRRRLTARPDRQAMSSDVPAPKNAAVGVIAPDRLMAIKVAPTSPKPIAPTSGAVLGVK